MPCSKRRKNKNESWNTHIKTRSENLNPSTHNNHTQPDTSMKYKPVSITLLCGLTAALGIVAHGRKEKNEVDHKATLEAGIKGNCHDCIPSGDYCNTIDTASTVMLAAICGNSQKKNDPVLMAMYKIRCASEQGTKARDNTTDPSSNSITRKEVCVPRARYACLPSMSGGQHEKTPEGKYVYRWQNQAEEPDSPGYPACGKRSVCLLLGKDADKK